MLHARFAEATRRANLVLLQGIQNILLVLFIVSLSLGAAFDVISKALNEFA